MTSGLTDLKGPVKREPDNMPMINGNGKTTMIYYFVNQEITFP